MERNLILVLDHSPEVLCTALLVGQARYLWDRHPKGSNDIQTKMSVKAILASREGMQSVRSGVSELEARGQRNGNSKLAA